MIRKSGIESRRRLVPMMIEVELAATEKPGWSKYSEVNAKPPIMR
jgi:hypothetical protein